MCTYIPKIHPIDRGVRQITIDNNAYVLGRHILMNNSWTSANDTFPVHPSPLVKLVALHYMSCKHNHGRRTSLVK